MCRRKSFNCVVCNSWLSMGDKPFRRFVGNMGLGCLFCLVRAKVLAWRADDASHHTSRRVPEL